MVKAEISIEFNKENQLHIELDLLKREDWTEEEWLFANSLQETLLTLTEILKRSGHAQELKREIIKERG